MDDLSKFELRTGAWIPSVALGLGDLAPTTDLSLKPSILHALKLGYRHFDTAELYGTELVLGVALKEAFDSGTVKREDVFVTTKIWPSNLDPDDVLPALQKSLSILQLDYVDLYLIHWPIRLSKDCPVALPIKEEDFRPFDVQATWKAMEHLVDLGLTKAIGVSNFSVKVLKELVCKASILPAYNQVEHHPIWQNTKLKEYSKKNGIRIGGWSPLGSPGSAPLWGTNAVLESPIIKEIAEKHGKTPAQVALRWAIESGVVVTVKSRNPNRQAENLDIFHWKLSEEDHEKINTLPQKRHADGSWFVNQTTSPYKSVEDLFDDTE